jgi:hypothetical protein
LRDRVTIASMRAHRSTRDTSSGGDSGGGSPGARTRTQALAVQRKVAPPRPIAATTPPSTAEPHDDPFALHLDPVQRRGGDERAGVHEAAARGIAGAGERLPHHDAIARAFGPDHDVSGIVAHTDGAARAAAADMGALGFATGNHVAFARRRAGRERWRRWAGVRVGWGDPGAAGRGAGARGQCLERRVERRRAGRERWRRWAGVRVGWGDPGAAGRGEGARRRVLSVGWSADGRVVSGGSDGRVCVWDGATLARQGEVKAHADRVMSVGWSADGRS